MIDACAGMVSEAEVTELMKEVRLFRTDVLAWLDAVYSSTTTEPGPKYNSVVLPSASISAPTKVDITWS